MGSGGVGPQPLALLEDQQPGSIRLFGEFQRVMALVGGGAGDVGQGVGTLEAHQENFAGLECVQREAGTHEGHRAGFGGDIDGFVMGWQSGYHHLNIRYGWTGEKTWATRLAMDISIERLCIENGLKMTGPRRVIARVLSEATDHPDVDELHRRANRLDARISLATVYRTVRLLEAKGILARRDLGSRRARYEPSGERNHFHLVDQESGTVLEFAAPDAEILLREIAGQQGFDVDVIKIELFGRRSAEMNTNVVPALPRFAIGNAAPGFAELRSGNLGVRLATGDAEIDAVQALRYRVFYEEMGAQADAATVAARRDADVVRCRGGPFAGRRP